MASIDWKRWIQIVVGLYLIVMAIASRALYPNDRSKLLREEYVLIPFFLLAIYSYRVNKQRNIELKEKLGHKESEPMVWPDEDLGET